MLMPCLRGSPMSILNVVWIFHSQNILARLCFKYCWYGIKNTFKFYLITIPLKMCFSYIFCEFSILTQNFYVYFKDLWNVLKVHLVVTLNCEHQSSAFWLLRTKTHFRGVHYILHTRMFWKFLQNWIFSQPMQTWWKRILIVWRKRSMPFHTIKLIINVLNVNNIIVTTKRNNKEIYNIFLTFVENRSKLRIAIS